ncbi:MAG: osmotically inducible protein OsmC [Waddliaceae bacterium]|nr:osmotically inducible protein OsmC [Waddliaceae bacterium]
MSEHRVQTKWERTSKSFEFDHYNREHIWCIEGKEIPASAAPEYKGKPSHVDPEQAFVASLSSCHMLTFLALAAKKRIVVDRYEDDAYGKLGKNDDGVMAITEVVLRPRVTFAAGHTTSYDELQKLHAKAHEHCFIANSVKCPIKILPQ